MLTAVVPVTNMAGRLQNLRSWINEAIDADMEVVIVHDFRDSNTQLELEEICANIKSKKISLLSGRFGSPGSARNYGMKHVTTEFVTFWDSDDLPRPEAYVMEIEKNNRKVDILIGQYIVRNKTLLPKNTFASSDYDLKAFSFNPGLWRMIFRRDLIGNLDFDEMKMGEDQVYLGKCLEKVETIDYTSTIFYEYFIEVDGQLTRSKSSRIQLIEAFNKIIEMRRTANSDQLKYLSIVITRMRITLFKIAITEKLYTRIIRQLTKKNLLFPSHPLIQIQSNLYVVYRLLKVLRK
jgi:glycosyltransferase involved in cell wall biosynthesis